MLMGIRLQAHPRSQQKLVLSQWMGCARFIWNAKCDEDRYLGSFARKYMPTGTYAPTDQKFSQYKDNDLSPWLKECPSHLLSLPLMIKLKDLGCGEVMGVKAKIIQLKEKRNNFCLSPAHLGF